jgi:hypothetical protein
MKNERRHKCEDISCSFIGRFDIVKMSIILKIIFSFNEISIKNPNEIFTEIEKNIKFKYIHKEFQIAKII